MNSRCLPWWRRKPTVWSDDCGADLHSLALLSPEEWFGFPRWLRGKASACPAGDTCPNPGSGNPLEKGTAIHSSILAWEMPWTEEPGGLQYMGPQRVGHNWATNVFTLNEQPQGKGRHWITSTDHQRLQPQWDLGCEVTQPWYQRHEVKRRSKESSCPASSALRQVHLSPFYRTTFDSWSSCCSRVPSIG